MINVADIVASSNNMAIFTRLLVSGIDCVGVVIRSHSLLARGRDSIKLRQEIQHKCRLSFIEFPMTLIQSIVRDLVLSSEMSFLERATTLFTAGFFINAYSRYSTLREQERNNVIMVNEIKAGIIGGASYALNSLMFRGCVTRYTGIDSAIGVISGITSMPLAPMVGAIAASGLIAYTIYLQDTTKQCGSKNLTNISTPLLAVSVMATAAGIPLIPTIGGAYTLALVVFAIEIYKFSMPECAPIAQLDATNGGSQII